MSNIHIVDTFPDLFEQVVQFHESIVPIVIMLITIGIIIHGYKGLQGDIQGMWGGVTKAIIIAILVPTLPDIVNNIQLIAHSLVEDTDANPSEASQTFANLIVGGSSEETDKGFMDILFDSNGGVGKALLYVALMIASLLALVIQYIYYIVQGFLTITGIALSPIFLSFFLISSLRATAVKYFTNLVTVLTWPIMWSIAALVTNALLKRAALAGIYETGATGVISTSSQSFFFAVTIAIWLILSTIAAPLVMSRVIAEGANAGGAIAKRVGSAIGLGASYGLIGGGTAQLSGGSATRVITSSAAAAAGGAVSGATGSSGVLLPTVIGITAARGNKKQNESQESTDYNSKAANIANQK